MSHSTFDYFQCLICSMCFSTLWKVEKHLKQHDNSDRPAQGVSTGGSRRGMLPIKKITFTHCYIPVGKNQIDPTFIEQYKREQTGNPFTLSFPEIGTTLQLSTKENLFGKNGMGRLARKSRIKAVEKIRKVSAILKIPEMREMSAEASEEFNYLKTLLDNEETDEDDFEDECPPKKLKRQSVKKNYNDDGDFQPPQEELNNEGEGGNRSDSDQQTQSVEKKRKKKKWKGIVLKCDYCEESLPKLFLRRHIFENHLDVAQTISCPLKACKRRFLQYAHARAHLNSHFLAEDYENQPELGKRWDIKSKENICSWENPRILLEDFYSCKFCLEACGSRKNLEDHLADKHPSPSNELKCISCDYGITEFENKVYNYFQHILDNHLNQIDPFGQRQVSAAKAKTQNKCDKCGKTFWNKKDLEKHVANHNKESTGTGIKKNPCPICKKGFSTKGKLRGHVTIHLGNSPYICDFPSCGRKFTSRDTLDRHKLLHLGKNPRDRYKCTLCARSFARKENLDRHMESYHEPNEIKKTSRTRRMRRAPFPKMWGTKDSQSSSDNLEIKMEAPPISSRVGESPQEMIKTKKDVHHANKGRVKVEKGWEEEVHFTDKILLTSDGSEVHIKGETLVPDFTSISSIPVPIKHNPPKRKRNRKSTKPNGKQVQKSLPLSSLSSETMESLLKDPKMKELQEKDPKLFQSLAASYDNVALGNSYKCSECDASFHRAWRLNIHLTTEHKKTLLEEVTKTSANGNGTGVSAKVMLMCGTCAYPAKDSADLKKHMAKFHKNVIKCKLCGLIFPDRAKLQVHIKRIHESEPKYICKICKKGYATWQYLSSHEKIHVDKKACPICKRMFCPRSLIQHLKRHERDRKIKNGEKVESKHKCQLCNDNFASPLSLQRHIDRIHLGKIMPKYKRKGTPEKNKSQDENNGDNSLEILGS